MARRRRRILVVAAAAMAVPLAPVRPAAGATARAWVVVDAVSGEVLAAKDARTRLRPASITKLLTAITARRELPPDAGVPISARADAQPPTEAGARAGEVWPLHAAYAGMLLPSGNDVAMAVAERVSGSAEAFGGAMVRAADALQLRDAPVLNDPAGLDGTTSVRGGNLISAADLAQVARAAIDDPVLAPVVRATRVTVSGPQMASRTLSTTNALLGTYAGAQGVKTGTTRAAGPSLASAATRDGRTIVVVVLGADDRYATTRQLLDRGFATPRGRGTGDRLPPVPLHDHKVRGASTAQPPPTSRAAARRRAAKAPRTVRLRPARRSTTAVD